MTKEQWTTGSLWEGEDLSPTDVPTPDTEGPVEQSAGCPSPSNSCHTQGCSKGC